MNIMHLDSQLARTSNIQLDDRNRLSLVSGEDKKIPIVTIGGLESQYIRHFIVSAREQYDGEFYIVSEQQQKILINQAKSKSAKSEQGEAEKRLNKIFERAINERASDVHFVRGDISCQIFFRVNGSINLIEEITNQDADTLIFVFYNVMSVTKETTWNRKSIQDSNAQIAVGNLLYRLRYAHMPIFGQSAENYHAVIRIIYPNSTNTAMQSVDELDLFDEKKSMLKRILSSSYGLFVVAGTTGSGKSTSLKNYMEILYNDKYKCNGCFLTVEDPVEYEINGAQQSSVTTGGDSDNKFADAVRSAMRRDPDVLMIGEIRDKATCAALTSAVESGHYCLTTTHAGSVIAVLQRLFSLGISIDKISSPGFIAGISCQKLVPCLCPECKEERYQEEIDFNFYVASSHGCPNCNFTGLKGRKLAIEFFIPTTEDLALIAKQEWVELFVQYRQRRAISFNNGLGEGYSLKEDIYFLVLNGEVCWNYFNLHFGNMEPDDKGLIYATYRAYIEAMKKHEDNKKANRLELYEILADLLSDNIPVHNALVKIQQDGKNVYSKSFTSNIDLIIQRMSATASLHETLDGLIPRDELVFIRVGEESGDIINVLYLLKKKIENLDAIRSKIKGAMFTPVLLFAAALIVITGYSLKVFPTFETILPVKTWPAITSNLYSFGLAIYHGLWLYLIAGLVTLYFIYLFLSRTLTGTMRDRYLDRVVPFNYYKLISTVEFLQTLSILLSSGVPLNESIDIVKGQSNRWMGSHLEFMRLEIAKGATYNEIFSSGLLDKKIVLTMSIYSELPDFGAVLRKLSETGNANLNVKVDKLAGYLKSGSLLILASSVVWIFGAIFSLVDKLSTSM